MTTPDLGVILPSMTAHGRLPGDLAAAARHAEALGFESVWVVDQLVAGTGTPFVDSVVALTQAATVTRRLRLGFGVMILPLHQVVWAAKQVSSLQYVSQGRVLLGVGAGGDRHELAWLAAGVPRAERGRRTDAALRVLPRLLSGEPTRIDELPSRPEIQLAPTRGVPPILVGGMSEAAMRRAVDYADGWFPLPALPPVIAQATVRLAAVAAERERPTPVVTASIMVALPRDPALPDDATLRHELTDVDGMFGMPADQIGAVLLRSTPDELARAIAAYGDAGASRLVISVAGGDWCRQTELVAEARARLP
jgi:alkanesulfonate monooxygenase SsuD/methylene tetrahydromethanopterin reductase-like flavin-dependent oxidoreductase (luciferase family)